MFLMIIAPSFTGKLINASKQEMNLKNKRTMHVIAQGSCYSVTTKKDWIHSSQLPVANIIEILQVLKP